MKDDIVKIINEFILGKQDALLVIQYIDNICIINSRPKKNFDNNSRRRLLERILFIRRL